MALQGVIGGGVESGLVGTSITAAGTTQATATELFAADNEVTTVASGSGVVLNRLITPQTEMTVFSVGLNELKVYPPSGMRINALPLNAPMLLAPNTGIYLKCISTTRVFGVLSA